MLPGAFTPSSQQQQDLRTPLLSESSVLTAVGLSPKSSPKGSKREEAERVLKARLASILYPGRSKGNEQESALYALEMHLLDKSPPLLQAWWRDEPREEEAPTSEDKASLAPADSPYDACAIKLQAAFRGRHARKHSVTAEDQPPAAAPMMMPKLTLIAGGAIAAVLLLAAFAFVPALRDLVGGGISLVASIVFSLVFYCVLLVLGLYAWVRLPRFLGWVGSEALTNFVLYGIPIGFETVRFVPWLTFDPFTLHADVAVSNFYLGNAPHIGCRDKDMVSVSSVLIALSVDLGFLRRLFNGDSLADNPIVVDVHTLVCTDINFNMMLGSTGIFNLYAIATTINEGEIRAKLPKGAPLPNVVRVKVLAARKLLALPNLKPRIEVSVRKVKVSAGVGERATDGHGATVFHFDGAEVTLPTPNAEAVLVVRVLNDNVGIGRAPALIGQWFMTLKWLVQCPEHCKHRSLTATGDGGVAGTFLLTDAKLRGSAVRGRGPHELGRGFSGELDMAIQWTHTTMLDDAPPPKKMGAIAQLSSTEDDDKLRFGNWPEFKSFLHGIPIRFDSDHFAFRRVNIEMSDLFVGAGSGHTGKGNAYVDSINFKRFNKVSMYSFFEVLAAQVIKSVAIDFTAIFTATGEIIGGLGANLNKQVYQAAVSTSAAATKLQAAMRGRLTRSKSREKSG